MRFIFLPLASLFFLAVFGCAKDSGSEKGGGASRSEDRNIHGPLASAVAELQNGNWQESCESGYAAEQREIALALDSRKDAIQQFRENFSNPDSEYETVSMGSFYVRQRKTPATIRPGWRSDQYGWKDIISDFKTIKDQPVNRAWSSLDSSVRSILVDDIDRAVKGFNYYLDKDSGPRLATMLKEIAACLADSSCTSPTLSPGTTDFISGQPDYRYYLDKVAEGTDSAAKRAVIVRWEKFAKGDYRSYEFTPNPGVKQISKGVFEVLFDAGPLSAHSEQFRSYVEPVWQSGDRQLKISFRNEPSSFHLELGAVSGERSFVRFDKKSMTLFPGVRTRAIAHEMGHVLGFRDHYYTVWNPATCGYIDQVSDEDLMSASDRGPVTPEEWDELLVNYPL